MKFKPEDMKIDSSILPSVLKPLFKTGSAALSAVFPPLAIPFALLGSVYSEITQQSTQKLLTKLDRQLDELQTTHFVSQEYLYSDHYIHLMTDVLRKAYTLNSDQKREVVAKIYKDVVKNKVEYADSDEKLFIEAIEKISAHEILILHFMSKNEEALKTIDSWKKFHSLYSNQYVDHPLDKYKFKLFASQLENMGLVYCSDLDGYDNYHVTMSWSSSRESSAGITPLGKAFLIYLENSG